VQEPVVPVAMKVQVSAVPVAVKVTDAPTVRPPIFIVGVSSFVILSLFRDPVSDEASKVGAAGAVKVTITFCSDIAERFPAPSTA
jgi:hypothetical protein